MGNKQSLLSCATGGERAEANTLDEPAPRLTTARAREDGEGQECLPKSDSWIETLVKLDYETPADADTTERSADVTSTVQDDAVTKELSHEDLEQSAIWGSSKSLDRYFDESWQVISQQIPVPPSLLSPSFVSPSLVSPSLVSPSLVFRLRINELKSVV